MEKRVDKAGYDCEDRSYLYPLFKKFIWERIARRLPPTLSPNTITLVGTLAEFTAFAILMVISPTDRIWFFMAGLLIMFYLFADNVDGLQARKTQRSSPMGEFLDHWTDSFNTGFLATGVCCALGMRDAWIVIALALSGLAYFATMWEQKVRGQLYFSRMGSVEGIIVIFLFLCLIALFGYAPFGEYRFFGVITLVEFFYYSSVFTYFMTALLAIIRVRQRILDFGAILFQTGICLMWYFGSPAQGFDIPIALILVFTACLYGGRQILCRLTNLTYLKTYVITLYLLVSTLISLTFNLHPDIQLHLAYGGVFILLLYLFSDFRRTGQKLKKFLVKGELATYFFQ